MCKRRFLCKKFMQSMWETAPSLVLGSLKGVFASVHRINRVFYTPDKRFD